MFNFFSRKALFFLVGILLMNAGFVYALETKYPTILGMTITNNSSLPEYARYFFNIGMTIAGTLAVMVIAFGGIYYLIDLGRGKFTDEGKDWLKAGMLGLLLIVSSYLIAYTINPYLVIFDLKGLAPLTFMANFFNPPAPSLPVEVYSEIPIGTLTESVLTKAVTCYDFDYRGDPLEGPLQTDGGEVIAGPTLVEHDRADCLLKLMQGAQAKAKIISDLGNEIKKLMEQCSCANKCSPACNCPGPLGVSPGVCNNACKGSVCKPTDSGYNSCCPDAVKEKIEHGPIKIDHCAVNSDVSIELAADTPSEASGPCKVNSLGGIMTKPRNIYIGSNVNRANVQWAVDTWNNTMKEIGRAPVFGNVMVNDGIINSYCFPSGWGNECVGGPPAPEGLDRIYFRPIDTKGKIPWQPSALIDYKIGNGEMKRYDINLDPGNRDLTCPNCYRMVLLHELGHSLGLDDAYNKQTGKFNSNCDDKTVMNNHFQMTGPGDEDKKKLGILYPSLTASLKNSFLANIALNQTADISSGVSCSNSSSGQCCKDREYKGLDEFRCPNPIKGAQITQCNNIGIMRARVQVNGKTVNIIDKNKWGNLNLVQQETYLKERIDGMKAWIKKDLDTLQKAESSLGQCYIADTYIDFLKTYEQTNKKDKIILIEKTFSDPETNQLINPAKYCQGFQYNNSICYSQCQKACPESAKDIKCYSNCPVDNNDCIKQCQGQQKCVLSSEFSNFQGCMGYCKQQCLDACDKICPEKDKNKCRDSCNNDSKCLLDNENKCLIDVLSLKECVKNYSDDESLKSCADSAALCKYCSDQYAGYPECLKSPYSLQDKYSSSFIYQNPEYQKCPNPYETISWINKDINGNQIKYTCKEGSPQTAKCPSASKCPKCPCDIADGPSKNTTENRVCSSDCESFSYNDDPLTFYCQQSWWLKEETKRTKPMGSEKICPKEREIPVGKTVDDAEKWAQDLLKKTDKTIKSISDILATLKKLSDKKEKEYCRCDSKFDNGKLICITICRYMVFLGTPFCITDACSKNSCQQMKDYLTKASQNYEQLRVSVLGFYNFVVIDERTDVLKELTYSRKKTNECSVIQNNFGAQTRILSCTRVEDEILSPIAGAASTSKAILGDRAISSYCYGKALGEILKTPDPLADNWFCCEDKTKK